MQLIHDWYMIQAGAIDPKARKMEFDDSLMGQLIRFVSSHEVGHTLGLRHNFGASSTVPVDSLRSKSWVEANGICPSIMDYARFNYVAQPEDGISEKGIFPRIGAYDLWAIEWGYKWLPQLQTEKEEKAYLNKWIIEKTNHDRRLWFGSETATMDPRCQSEDLGDNAMKAGYYGIQNLKRILPQLTQWTKEPNEDYDDLKRMYTGVVGQYRRYLGHVADNIGGVYVTPKTVEQQGVVLQVLDRNRQVEAMRFLQMQLFTTPRWLLDQKVFALTGSGTGLYALVGIQQGVLKKLMSQKMFGALLHNEMDYATKDPYTVREFLGDMKTGIWSELKTHAPIDLYRRNLQKAYVERLIQMVHPDGKELSSDFFEFVYTGLNVRTDVPSLVKGHIRELVAAIKTALPGYKDPLMRMHLEDVRDRLVKAVDKKSALEEEGESGSSAEGIDDRW
jgi:hypothetical protein